MLRFGLVVVGLEDDEEENESVVASESESVDEILNVGFVRGMVDGGEMNIWGVFFRDSRIFQCSCSYFSLPPSYPSPCSCSYSCSSSYFYSSLSPP